MPGLSQDLQNKIRNFHMKEEAEGKLPYQQLQRSKLDPVDSDMVRWMAGLILRQDRHIKTVLEPRIQALEEALKELKQSVQCNDVT